MAVSSSTSARTCQALSEAAVAWGDHDNDGDLDVLLTGRVGINHFTIICRNDGGVFADIGADLAGVSSGSVAWGDCDNDGDLDILLTGDNGTSKVSRVLRNDPGGFVDIGAGLPGIYKGTAIWGDHDNDGDLDLAVVGNQGSVADVYRNNGGTFSDAGFSMYGMLYCDAAWGDYDNDGDLDLLTVGEPTSSAASVIYRNDSGNLVYTEPGLGYVYNCAVAWGDYDGDGDLDIVLAGYNSIDDTDKTWLYRNVSGDFIDVGAGLPGVSFSDVAWGDYDDDGDLDLALTGSSSSGSISRIYRNNDQTPSTPPTSPTGLTSTWNADDTLTLQWAPATDAETASSGLTYNLRVGTTPGGSEICSAMALPSGRRTVARLGNVNHNTSWTLQVPIGVYYWSVQAVDPSFIGSPFATEQAVADPTDVPDFVPTRFALHAAVPNPFNPQTTIGYDLPRETRLTLVIYDLTGRRVRTLLAGAVEPAGRHDVVWNGLDDGGRQVPSGVYCCRIEAGSFGATRRLTLLK